MKTMDTTITTKLGPKESTSISSKVWISIIVLCQSRHIALSAPYTSILAVLRIHFTLMRIRIQEAKILRIQRIRILKYRFARHDVNRLLHLQSQNQFLFPSSYLLSFFSKTNISIQRDKKQFSNILFHILLFPVKASQETTCRRTIF